MLRPLPSPAPSGWRLTPLDVFAAVNLALFILMCAFTYYARFVDYRGAANVWEFFVYATVIIAGIGMLWRFLRGFAFDVFLLVLIQAGILAHFAGAFVQVDGHRLYDAYLAGIRYDKYVHLANAFVAGRVVLHVVFRRGMHLVPMNRLLVLLAVLGLGAFVEIVEYIVCSTIPGSGVGGYDNNMQDLVANLAGGTLSVSAVTRRRWPRDGRSRVEAAASPGMASGPAVGRTFSLIELFVLLAGTLSVIWLGPWLVTLPAFVPVARFVLCAVVVYVFYVSPVWLHRDSLRARGLGTWRSGFVRTDNLKEAGLRFAGLTVAGAVAILLLAEVINPDWLARANWKAWVVRLGFYSLSATAQALFFVGFFLVRVRELMPAAAGPASASRTPRLLVSLGAGVAFGAMHAPSALQVGLTAAFGTAVTWISLRRPNVFAAAVSQIVLGLLVHRVLELTLRIGAFYLHPEVKMMRDVWPFSGALIGTLF